MFERHQICQVVKPPPRQVAFNEADQLKKGSLSRPYVGGSSWFCGTWRANYNINCWSRQARNDRQVVVVVLLALTTIIKLMMKLINYARVAVHSWRLVVVVNVELASLACGGAQKCTPASALVVFNNMLLWVAVAHSTSVKMAKRGMRDPPLWLINNNNESSLFLSLSHRAPLWLEVSVFPFVVGCSRWLL